MATRPVLAVSVGLAVVCGIVLRAWIASSSLGALDSDEAVVGLMARQIGDGSFPIFYWGQEYGGALEAYLAAPGLAFAPTSVAALKAVPLVLHVVALGLCYLIGARMDSRRTGLFAAALLWIWPGYYVWWSLKERGFYGAVLVAGLASWWLALRIDDGNRTRDWFLLGLSAGIGWWLSPQVVFLVLPALVWLMLRRRLSVGGIGFVFAGAVVGALPWIYANARTGLASFDIPSLPAVDNTYSMRLRSFFEEALPVATGFRLERLHWFLEPFGMIAFSIGLGVLVMVLFRSHRLLALGMLGYPFLYAISPFSQGEARFLYLLAPILVLVIVSATENDVVRLGIVLLAGVLSAGNLVAMDRHSTATPPAPDVLIPGDLRALSERLEEIGAKSVYADYWIAYPLVFHSGGSVVATPFRGLVRNQQLDASVRSATGSRYVLPGDSMTLDLVRDAFAAGGNPFEETTIDGFVLIRSDASLTPEAIPGLQAPALGAR